MSEFPNKKTQFKEGNPGGGRPKGAKNRSTLLKKWLTVKTKIKNPETGQEEKVELSDAITLGIIKKAISGDVQAYKEIMDTLHGKIPDKQELTGKDGEPFISNITDNELIDRINKIINSAKEK